MFITDYIKVYENAIPTELCDVLVQRLDESPDTHRHNDTTDTTPPRQIRTCTELVISKYEAFKDVQAVMMKVSELSVGKYQSEIPVRTFPKEIGCESYRLQKYAPGDHYEYHVDVNDYASARRFVNLVWFLNDVEQGGEYFFPHPNIRIRPIKSRLVVFPSTWIYPYSIGAPVSNPSYTISTFLHYI